MSSPLFGRAVEPKLVRQLLMRQPEGSRPQPPILLLEGGTATGKTALLGELARGWMGKVPYSYLDVAAVEEELGEQSAPELLAAIASQLARRCQLYGSLRFDRLVIGLEAMRLDLSDVDPGSARTQVAAMLNERRGLATLKRVLGGVAQEALKLVPSPIGSPAGVVDLAVGAAVDGLAGPLLSGNALGRAKSWYGHQDRGLVLDPIGQLIDLNWARRHPARADARSQVDELLCDAFLADLRDNFRTGRHSAEWPLNCLVLLDNVDRGLGQSFLRQLNALREPVDGADVDRPSPLLVVGGSRGKLIAGMTLVERATVVELTGTRDLAAGNGQQPVWGRRLLPSLSLDDVRKMSPAALASYRQNNNLAGMLHHLTGGHPGGLAFLLKVITDLRPENLEPAALLALPYRDTTVEQTLAARLLAGLAEDDVELLVTCSAGRDRHEGLRLLGRAVDRDTAALVLPAGLWDPAGDVPVTLPRTLLLRRLARRPEDHPWDWTRSHAVSHAAAGPAGETAELHHRLAMGDVRPVLDALAAKLGTEPLPVWLTWIETVAAAPARFARPDPPAGDWPPFLPPLLTRLWRAADPLLGSDRSVLYARIAGGFNDLATHLDDTCDELLDLVARYQNLARLWHRAVGRPPE
ncbi:hypothetical protein [Amycolatopsis sp. H20-H5]|uniref:hypothetical protein n=1 Tax=Amycolatopsis sp. H20-H5 TaxID=3046309 RepID=UPI002DB75B93|nr:hypothetical protein [Amycolatopsis sp. H20-H5]MEC3975911.1 hypothetical protein [Amycolatopsis sp. H20-H5]